MSKNIRESDSYIFKPSFFIRNRHLQSILASSGLSLPGKNPLFKQSQKVIVTTSRGSRPLSFLSSPATARGVSTLRHGWEGASSSAYILSAGRYFHSLGFTICRLNLRDHG